MRIRSDEREAIRKNLVPQVILKTLDKWFDKKEGYNKKESEAAYKRLLEYEN